MRRTNLFRNNMNEIFFEPYIVKDCEENPVMYGKADGFFKGIKVMAIGNNHYCKEDFDHVTRCGKNCSKYTYECNSFTQGVVDTYLSDPNSVFRRDDKRRILYDENRKPKRKDWVRNYTKFARLFNAENTEDLRNFWKSIAFYNFLQRAVPDYKSQGTSEEIQLSQKLVFKAIEKCDPDVIIVWGRDNVFNHLPKENLPEGIKWTWDKESQNSGCYEINGKKIPVICTHHPQYYRYEQNRAIIQKIYPELFER